MLAQALPGERDEGRLRALADLYGSPELTGELQRALEVFDRSTLGRRAAACGTTYGVRLVAASGTVVWLDAVLQEQGSRSLIEFIAASHELEAGVELAIHKAAVLADAGHAVQEIGIFCLADGSLVPVPNLPVRLARLGGSAGVSS
jgi:hypothetical protein